jgi:hypothetical protein
LDRKINPEMPGIATSVISRSEALIGASPRASIAEVKAPQSNRSAQYRGKTRRNQRFIVYYEDV